MKRLCVIFLLLAASAHAGWPDLKAGLDPEAVARAVGQPLLQSAGHGGRYATWTYDQGGFVMFHQGRVTFWQAPREVDAKKK